MNNLSLFCVLLIFVGGIGAEKSYKELGEKLLQYVGYHRMKDDLKVVKNIIDEGANPLYVGGNRSRSALLIAASNADTKMVDYLLNIPAVKNSNLINLGSTSEHWKEDSDVYLYFNAYNSNGTPEDCIKKRMKYRGVTPLEAAICDETYSAGGGSSGALSNSYGIINKMAQRGFTNIEKYDRVGTVKRLLKEQNIDLTLGNRNVLSAAVEFGKHDDYKIVKLLIEELKKISKLDYMINLIRPKFYDQFDNNNFGDDLPLIIAINYDVPLDIIELLLKNGAKPNLKGGDKKSALEVAKSKLAALKSKVTNKELSNVDYIANKLGVNFGVPGKINKLEKIIKLFEKYSGGKKDISSQLFVEENADIELLILNLEDSVKKFLKKQINEKALKQKVTEFEDDIKVTLGSNSKENQDLKKPLKYAQSYLDNYKKSYKISSDPVTRFWSDVINTLKKYSAK